MKYTFLFLTLLIFTGLSAQPDLELTTILPAGSLSSPVDIQSPDDGTERLFIVQKNGTVRIVDLLTNTLVPGNFLDIRSKVRNSGEQGFLGLAFHPNFATNGEFFINYSTNGPIEDAVTGDNVISRITLAAPGDDTADPATEEVLMTLSQPYGNHNGGDLAFGPDGYLYIGTGDGGSGGDPEQSGQDPQSLLGKMLRIDVDTSIVGGLAYGIPADNPFLEDGDGIRDEIWAFGIRNPWRYSFDRETGDLWIGDVGQNAREEINFEPAGSPGGLNYGWNCREGLIAYPFPGNLCNSTATYVDPVADMSHSGSASAFSITGGNRYRGGAWPDLVGTYICADFVTDIFFIISEDANGDWEMTSQNGLPVDGVTGFGESERGELYLVDFDGQLLQVGGGTPSSTRDIFATADFKVTVSPNPTSDLLRVDLGDLNEDKIMKVRLVDIEGRTLLSQVWSLPSGPHAREIHLPDLPAGVYRLLVTDHKGGRVVPVVIR